jgi:hypothetical protein
MFLSFSSEFLCRLFGKNANQLVGGYLTNHNFLVYKSHAIEFMPQELFNFSHHGVITPKILNLGPYNHKDVFHLTVLNDDVRSEPNIILGAGDLEMGENPHMEFSILPEEPDLLVPNLLRDAGCWRNAIEGELIQIVGCNWHALM